MVSCAQAKKFIEIIGAIIQEEAYNRGYKVCSPIIAQACCESAFGTSSLGYRYHNYFGLKCGKNWKGASINMKTKEEYNPGTLTTIKDNFRVYPSMEDGVKGYFDFISMPRYSNLKSALTPLEYLEMIKRDGYATSSTYVNTNMNIVNKYNLTKFDIRPYMEKSLDEIAKEVINGLWGNGSERKQRLRAAGYNPAMVQARVNEIVKARQ